MLGLRTESDPGWIRVALSDPGRLLQDHAHCEKKAAATALSIVSVVPDRPELVGPLTVLAQEETRHFFKVLAELEHRGLPLGRCPVNPYAQALQRLVRGTGLVRLRDRLLVGSLIEARSCERFSLLSRRCGDERLRRLWGGLFEAEAKHHTLFLELARVVAGPDAARVRLAELAEEEAAILAAAPLRVAIH